MTPFGCLVVFVSPMLAPGVTRLLRSSATSGRERAGEHTGEAGAHRGGVHT